MKILVTGGAGYIGSHTCVELLNEGYEVVVVDNLRNSSEESLSRVEEITGKKLKFVYGDIRNTGMMLTELYGVDAVMHFAAHKSVSESVENPLKYYENNVLGLIRLLDAMKHHKIKKMIFSSSATVYGDPEYIPLDENARLNVTNPYGRTKLMCEQMLWDMDIHSAILRYFNPVGAHPSGLIGEDPIGTPANLLPFVSQVAAGLHPKVKIFGDDYDTHDGTGVRDYIHVVDLAKAHVAALQFIIENESGLTVNLGTGQGYSVLEMINAFEIASGKYIPREIVERRAGDIGVCYTDPKYASMILGWKAEKTLQDMVNDHWRWQLMNPNGYEE